VKYLCLLWANEARMPAPGTPEFDSQNGAYGAYYEEVSSKGAFVTGEPLQPSSAARTVRVRDGKTDATGGPFTAGAEQLIGFYVLDVASDDEAVSWAAKIPAASNGAIEVRPVLSM
jgi:hypothetical protein